MSAAPEKPSDELAELLCLFCSGDADPLQLAQLQERVAAGDQALAYYVEYMQIHGGLEWAFRHQYAVPETLCTAVAAVEAAPESPARPAPIGHLSWLASALPARLLALGLVMTLVGYFVIMMALIPLARLAETTRADHRSPAAGPDWRLPADAGVGSVAADELARWAPDSASPSHGQLRNGRRYRLAAGHVQMALAGGVRVWIEAPAEFETQSGERLRLARGRLSAQVPPAGRGFTVATPAAEVIDLGTEFGVDVDDRGRTDVHVLRGNVEIKQVRPTAEPTGSPISAAPVKVSAGQAVRVSKAGELPTQIPVDPRAFAGAGAKPAAATPAGRQSDVGLTQVRLSNLFGHRAGTSLIAAMEVDTFGAEADTNDIGVVRVVYGGPPKTEIALGIPFDLTSVGWQDAAAFKVANDGVCMPIQGLRLTGKGDDIQLAKMQDGIGMHANSLVTFSLPEIRRAWRQPRAPLRFVCDAAGVNDGVVTAIPPGSSLHLVGIVSSRTGPLSAIVDGSVAQLGEQDGRAFVQSDAGPPLRADGRVFSVDLPLPPEAEYLTLVCTSAGDGYHADHGAWLGARLEVVP